MVTILEPPCSREGRKDGIERNDEYCLGQLRYYIMITITVSGTLVG